MWTKVQFLGWGWCVAARIVVASCDIERPSQKSSAHPKNKQSHPSRKVPVDHPKQLMFSWTTEKKRSRQDCQRHYQIMIGYVHMRVFFPINREESHLTLFSYDITVDPFILSLVKFNCDFLFGYFCVRGDLHSYIL